MADGLKRLSNMVKGGFDKWLDEYTDPIVDLEQDIKDGLKEYSELIGKQGVQQQRVEDARKEVNKYQGLVDRYHKIACAALNEGNELDATRALKKRQSMNLYLKRLKLQWTSMRLLHMRCRWIFWNMQSSLRAVKWS